MELHSQQSTLMTTDDVKQYLNLLLNIGGKLHDPAISPVWPQLIDDDIDWVGQISCLQTQEEYCRLGAAKLLNLADYFIALEQMIKNLQGLSSSLREVNRSFQERVNCLEHELILPFGYRSTKHIYARIAIIKANRWFVRWHLHQVETKITSFQDAQNKCMLPAGSVSIQSHPWLYYDRCLSQNDDRAELITARLRERLFSSTEEGWIDEALDLRNHLGVAVVRNRPTTLGSRDVEVYRTEQWIAARV